MNSPNLINKVLIISIYNSKSLMWPPLLLFPGEMNSPTINFYFKNFHYFKFTHHAYSNTRKSND